MALPRRVKGLSLHRLPELAQQIQNREEDQDDAQERQQDAEGLRSAEFVEQHEKRSA